MLSTKLWFIWPSSFSGEDFQKMIDQKQELLMATMFANGSGQNEQSLQKIFHRRFHPFRFICPIGFRGFQKSTNQKQELRMRAMFVNGSGCNQHSLERTFHKCFLPSFSSFGQVVSEEKFFQKLTNQKQELPIVAIFVNGSERYDR